MPGKADMERNGSMWPVMVSAVLLSGAAVAALRFGVESVPEIARVRLGEMTAAYMNRAAAPGAGRRRTCGPRERRSKPRSNGYGMAELTGTDLQESRVYIYNCSLPPGYRGGAGSHG